MPQNFFECEQPLLEEPPSNVGLESNSKHPPGGAVKPVKIFKNTKEAQREGFVVGGVWRGEIIVSFT